MTTSNGGELGEWQTRKLALKGIPIPRRTFEEWVALGFVRTVKFGDSAQQGRRLYNINDLRENLERLAAGKPLRVKRGGRR